MKKYIVFVGSFIVAFLLLEVLSGMLLTVLYTPNVSQGWNLATTSQVEIVSANITYPLTLGLLSLVAAFGVIRLFKKKTISSE